MASRHAKAPISAHSLFPVIVAIWFAALFGLGCGVLPNTLFERIVTASGLASLIPAAAPPLGVTARIVISVSAALVGAAAGFTIARKVAAAQSEPRANGFAQRYAAPVLDERARRPISAKEELGSATLDAPATGHGLADIVPQPIPGRRRALAMAEDNRPSDFLHAAPLPGSEPHWNDQPAEPVPAMQVSSAFTVEPLELREFVPEEPEAPADIALDPGLAALRNAPDAAPAEAEAEPAAPAEPAPRADAVPPLFAKPLFDDESFEEIAQEPRPFAAPQAEATPEPAIAEPPAETADAEAPVEHAPSGRRPGDPGVPLDTLGMVELAERLGQSLQQRLKRPSTPPPSFAEILADVPGAEDELAQAVADAEFPAETACEAAEPPFAVPHAEDEDLQAFGQQFAPPPPVIPAALRPLPLELDAFGEEEEDEEDYRASFSLPLAGFTAPPPAPSFTADDDAEDDEDDADSENYSSLLSIKSPFRSAPEFVRIEEPEAEPDTVEPAVVFPGEKTPPAIGEVSTPEPAESGDIAPEARPFDAPPEATAPRRRPDPDETERALRSALATLQRMSGAA